MNKKTKKRWMIVSAISISVILLIIVFSMTSSNIPETTAGNVAVIKINGEIGGTSILGGGVDSDDVLELIQEAENNKGIDAILLEINSPGGSPVASEEIANAVKESSKLSIALIRDIGASGAYWIASAADVVIASPASLTGSIGVTASYLEFTGLMEKYGIGYEEIKSGEYKELGSPFRTLTEKEKDIFQEKIDELHEYFVKSIRENRKLNDNQTKEVSTAMFYLGSEAKQLGLVDVLGGRKEAEEIIKARLVVKKVNFIEYRKAKGFFELLSEVIAGQSLSIKNQPVIQAK